MKYHLTLDSAFPQPVRRRAGIEIPKAGGVIAELTEDQLGAIQADPEIRVTAVVDEEVETTTDAPTVPTDKQAPKTKGKKA